MLEAIDTQRRCLAKKTIGFYWICTGKAAIDVGRKCNRKDPTTAHQRQNIIVQKRDTSSWMRTQSDRERGEMVERKEEEWKREKRVSLPSFLPTPLDPISFPTDHWTLLLVRRLNMMIGQLCYKLLYWYCNTTCMTTGKRERRGGSRRRDANNITL